MENIWSIRPAVVEDIPVILQMIKDLAVYEKEPESSVKTTEDILLRDGFGEKPCFKCLIAEDSASEPSVRVSSEAPKKKSVGYALYFYGYSTWHGRVLYLEDLYVDPSSRGKGIGKGLLKKIAQIAVEDGCYKMHWMVLTWNKIAIDVYNSIGAECMEEWRMHRLAGKSMLEFAGKP